MYMIVFGRIAGIPTDDVPQPVFYMSGVCLWEYFSTCLTDAAGTFSKNAGLFGKVYFPRLVSPLSVVLSKLFRFSIQLLMFVIIYLFFVFAKGVHLCPNWYLLLFPVIILIMQGLALGLGLIISSLTTKYRDLQIMLAKIISLWVYITPVIYPLSMVTNEKLHLAMSLNPVTPVMEAIKYSLLGQGQFSWLWLAYSAVFTLILLIFGLMMFNKVQKSFMDTV
jgi:lipopolysaccharide transport system permease protein